MSNDVCDSIENDEFFKQFLASETIVPDLKATLSFSDQISKLTEGLDVLSTELQSQVRQEHGALLSQASHAGRLENSLEAVTRHMEQLQSGADHLRNKITTPFKLLENQTKVLNRLHEASHLLRQSGRFLQLHRELEQTKDVSKQAFILFELEPLVEDEELGRIEMILEEKAFVIATRRRLNNLAQRDLTNGLKNGNATLTSQSLQIFANLQTLQKNVDNLLTTFLADIKHGIKECLDGTDITCITSKKPKATNAGKRNTEIRVPGKVTAPNSSQNFRTKLWSAMEWLLDEEIYSYCQQVNLLQKSLEVVTKQQNDFQQSSEGTVIQQFIQKLEQLLVDAFNTCAIHVSQTLQQGLPKLLAIAKNFQQKLGQSFSDKLFASLEAGYLEKCAINLKAPLAGTSCPTQESADALVRAASAELGAALVDDRLCLLVANAFNACNQDFWSKIEAHVKLGADSKQVVDIPNASQIQNTIMANAIYNHCELVKRMVSNLGPIFEKSEAAEKIIAALATGRTLILAIIQQLIDSINVAVNVILLSIHREPGLNNERLTAAGPSLYMKELQDFLLRAWQAHIQPFEARECVDQCSRELSSRSIELFVWNVSIVRAISQAGRNRLKSDCQHLENALKPIVNDLTTLGKSFRLLRALATLIISSPETLSTQSIDVGNIVEPFIVLMILFGHAGTDLVSPHTVAGWSNEKLLQWLDGHTSDKERLELISGALQKYRNIVRQKNIAQYDPVYPFIASYLEKAVKSL